MANASDKQINLINRLLASIEKGLDPLAEGDPIVIATDALLGTQQASLVTVASGEPLDGRKASVLIDTLFAAEKLLPPTEVRWTKEGDTWLLKGPTAVLVEGTEVVTQTSKGEKPAKVGAIVRTEGATTFAFVGRDEPVADLPDGQHRNADGQLVTVKRTRSGQQVAFIDGEYCGKRGLRGLSASTLLTNAELALANPVAALIARLDAEATVIRIALDNAEGAANSLSFWVLNADGTVEQTIGGTGDVPARNPEAVIVKAAALSDEELAAAVIRYGVELGTCGACGRLLTSDWRLRGIGPDCAKKGLFAGAF